MKRAWTLALAGSVSLSALAGPSFADDAKDAPAEAPKPAEVRPAPAAAPAAVTPAPAGVFAAPTVVGDYIVGDIHHPPTGQEWWHAHEAHKAYRDYYDDKGPIGLHLDRIHQAPVLPPFRYSLFNPYMDELHAPVRQAMYSGAHARYYAGYRSVYAPNWHEFYVPRYYAPSCYGYDPYGPSYYGYGQTRSSYYAPNYDLPNGPGASTAAAVPPAPPAGYNPSGFRYTGDPSFFSPFGAGSASYFGVYGSAGY